MCRIRVVLQHLLYRLEGKFVKWTFTCSFHFIIRFFVTQRYKVIHQLSDKLKYCSILEIFVSEMMNPILDTFESSLNYEMNIILYKQGSVKTSLKWYKSEKCPELPTLLKYNLIEATGNKTGKDWATCYALLNVLLREVTRSGKGFGCSVKG